MYSMDNHSGWVFAGYLFNSDVAGMEPTSTHFKLTMDLGDDNPVGLSFCNSDDAESLVDYESQTVLAKNNSAMEYVGVTKELVTAEKFVVSEDSGLAIQLAAEF